MNFFFYPEKQKSCSFLLSIFPFSFNRSLAFIKKIISIALIFQLLFPPDVLRAMNPDELPVCLPRRPSAAASLADQVTASSSACAVGASSAEELGFLDKFSPRTLQKMLEVLEKIVPSEPGAKIKMEVILDIFVTNISAHMATKLLNAFGENVFFRTLFQESKDFERDAKGKGAEKPSYLKTKMKKFFPIIKQKLRERWDYEKEMASCQPRAYFLNINFVSFFVDNFHGKLIRFLFDKFLYRRIFQELGYACGYWIHRSHPGKCLQEKAEQLHQKVSRAKKSTVKRTTEALQNSLLDIVEITLILKELLKEIFPEDENERDSIENERESVEDESSLLITVLQSIAWEGFGYPDAEGDVLGRCPSNTNSVVARFVSPMMPYIREILQFTGVREALDDLRKEISLTSLKAIWQEGIGVIKTAQGVGADALRLSSAKNLAERLRVSLDIRVGAKKVNRGIGSGKRLPPFIGRPLKRIIKKTQVLEDRVGRVGTVIAALGKIPVSVMMYGAACAVEYCVPSASPLICFFYPTFGSHMLYASAIILHGVCAAELQRTRHLGWGIGARTIDMLALFQTVRLVVSKIIEIDIIDPWSQPVPVIATALAIGIAEEFTDEKGTPSKKGKAPQTSYIRLLSGWAASSVMVGVAVLDTLPSLTRRMTCVTAAMGGLTMMLGVSCLRRFCKKTPAAKIEEVDE